MIAPASPPDAARELPARDAASLRRVVPRHLGRLPRLAAREHWSVQLAFVAILLAILAGFWGFTQQFWVAGHGGTDQNGYLVGGRNIAAHFTAGFGPEDPYAFVGRMWVAAPDGRYFPKYPLGLPVLVAAVLKIAGPTAVYFISPVAMTLALLGVFVLVHQVAGSFGGILGTLIVATSPVTLGLANNPNSHATALCAVTWGFCLLLRWWRHDGFRRAALAGLLIGCAATVRYSEAVLGLPLILVGLFNLRWRDRRSWGQVATLVGCWAAPILLLLFVNRLTMGSWTGYDVTGESTGFGLRYLGRNWEVVLRQLAGTGLFLTLPIGVTGLILLLARNWRLAVVLWAWLLPGVLLYSAYYWAPEGAGIAYLRFFLTVFPPLAVGAAWCMTHLVPVAPHAGWAFRRIVAPAAALVIVLGAGAYNVWAALPMLAGECRRGTIVADAADKVTAQAKAPAGSVVFGPREVLHHLQFVGDYRLYAGEEFDRRYLGALEPADPAEPRALQPERAAAFHDLLTRHDDRRLAGLLRDLVAKALEGGHRVFAILPAEGPLPQRFDAAEFDRADGRSFAKRTLVTWSEPPNLPDRLRRRASAPGPGGSDGDDVTPPPLAWRLVEVTRVAR